MAGWSVATSSSKGPLQSQAPTTTTTLIGPVTTTSSTTVPPTTTTTAPADAHLTINATNLTVGELVTVTGTGCPVGSWGMPELYGGPNSPWIFDGPNMGDLEAYFRTNSYDVSEGEVTSDPRWSATGRVSMVPTGPTLLGAMCMPSVGFSGPVEFQYPTLWVDVTYTPYRLDVQPSTTVEPGATLSITSLGGGCPIEFPQVSLYSRSHADVADARLTVADQSPVAWHANLVVPRTLKPGAYGLEADCVGSRTVVYGTYAQRTITVRT